MLYLKLSCALLGSSFFYWKHVSSSIVTGAYASSKHLVCQPVSNDRVPWNLRSLSSQWQSVIQHWPLSWPTPRPAIPLPHKNTADWRLHFQCPFLQIYDGILNSERWEIYCEAETHTKIAHQIEFFPDARAHVLLISDYDECCHRMMERSETTSWQLRKWLNVSDMTNPHRIKQRSLCKERPISEVVGNCPFSPELQERKMEYELLELSLGSFSYCCVIFDVIDAGVSGHIFFLEIAFNFPPRSHSTIILVLLLRNISPPNTSSSEVYSGHDSLFAISLPLALNAPARCVWSAGPKWKVCIKNKMFWSLLCEIRRVSINLCWERSGCFVGSALPRGAGSRIWVLSECTWSVELDVWQCRVADCKMTAEVNRLLRIQQTG